MGEGAPKLRGDLARESEKSPPRLSGSLVNKKEASESGGEIKVGDKFIQRDSGVVFTVEAINDDRFGPKVFLRSEKNKSTVNLVHRNLSDSLKTPGGAWQRKS